MTYTYTFSKVSNEICCDIDIKEDVDRIALEISVMGLNIEDAIDEAYDRLWDIFPDRVLTNEIARNIINKILEEVQRRRDERVRNRLV